jgi:small subunit ribosomal protein S8
MVTDPIADLIIRLRNASRRGHEATTIPASGLKRRLLHVLQAEGFVGVIEDVQEHGHPALRVQLRYVGDERPMITGMQRISKPGRRVYVGKQEIPKVRNGIGVAILSTSKGLMTDQESRRAGLGGEILCSVW